MINLTRRSDPPPIRTNFDHPLPADGHSAPPATAAEAILRCPGTLGCQGTPHHPHERVTWVGTWIPREGDVTCDPPCWVCGAPGHSTPPRYPRFNLLSTPIPDTRLGRIRQDDMNEHK
jgi:hypothetical protein